MISEFHDECLHGCMMGPKQAGQCPLHILGTSDDKSDEMCAW